MWGSFKLSLLSTNAAASVFAVTQEFPVFSTPQFMSECVRLLPAGVPPPDRKFVQALAESERLAGSTVIVRSAAAAGKVSVLYAHPDYGHKSFEEVRDGLGETIGVMMFTR